MQPIHRQADSKPSRRRRGLAPLELVMSLPILLMVMGLMVYYGNAACWKLRAANVARDTVWSSRWPRGGQTPWPQAWPQNANRGVAAAGNLAVLAFDSIDQPVARGPMIGQIPVYRNLLDPTQGLLQGTSDISTPSPLMSNLGRIRFDLRHPLLDNAWQYPRFGMGSNQQRREPIIYNLPKADAQYIQAYMQAAMAIYFAPFVSQLAPLDQDGEIFAFYGNFHDFHPRLQGFCSLDKQMVQQQLVPNLVDRIQGKKKPHVAGVPEQMTRFFLQLYKAELAALQAQAGGQAPAAQTAALQQNIQQLNAFLGQLQ